jgi:hypothetical protein
MDILKYGKKKYYKEILQRTRFFKRINMTQQQILDVCKKYNNILTVLGVIKGSRKDILIFNKNGKK